MADSVPEDSVTPWPDEFRAALEAAGVTPERAQFFAFPSLPSTMDTARELLRDSEAAHGGVPSPVVVVAREQTSGRGQGGRSWFTDQGGGLALSLAFRCPKVSGALPLLCGLAALDAIAEVGVAAHLKWPNDVVVERDGRLLKLAGILCESATAGREAVVCVGLGMNINVEAFPDEVPGISLMQLAGRRLSRAAIFAELSRRLLQTIELGGADEFRVPCEAYESKMVWRGCRRQFMSNGSVQPVTVLGVSADGGLRCLCDSGPEIMYSGSLVDGESC